MRTPELRNDTLVRRPCLGQRRLRLAQAVFLLIELAVAMNSELQVFRECVDDRYADAMETARNLVRGVVELTAGVQHGHDHFCGRATLLRMDIHRYSTAVIGHSDRLVGMDRDRYFAAVTSQCFVNGVVYYLEHHVVQTGAVVGVTDVHSWSLADRIETLQNLDFA
jgi:hypothetical protein